MDVNEVRLLGRLGQNPELKGTGTMVCNLSVATGYRTKDGKESTEWHRVVCFGKTAENCSKFLTKGSQLYVAGRLQTRKWQDKEGKDRYSTEVVADTVTFLGGKPSGGGQSRSETEDPTGGYAPETPPDDSEIPF